MLCYQPLHTSETIRFSPLTTSTGYKSIPLENADLEIESLPTDKYPSLRLIGEHMENNTMIIPSSYQRLYGRGLFTI